MDDTYEEGMNEEYGGICDWSRAEVARRSNGFGRCERGRSDLKTGAGVQSVGG